MAYTFMTENLHEGKYKVKRDNYELVSLLSNSSILPDVTLVTEDGIERESHRILLAAISPFLKDLMLNTKEDNVSIYLDGIGHKYLDLILTILNTGTVYPNNADETLEFMNICLSLGINNMNLFNAEQIEETPVKIVKETAMDGNEESLKKLKCVHCDRHFRLRSNLSHHIKGIHEKVRYPCNFCKKQFYDKRSLKNHSCKGFEEKPRTRNHNITRNMQGNYQCS